MQQPFTTLKRSRLEIPKGARVNSVVVAGNTDGYDGHSLRAYAYFGDQMPDIDPNSVESINSISKKEGALRQQSKAPTFRPYLSGYLPDPDDQLWLPGSKGPHD